MEDFIETNEIWCERVENLRKLDRRVRRLLCRSLPLKHKLAAWERILVDLTIDNNHQDILIGRLLKKL